MKNTISEMKTTLEGINSSLDEAEDQTSDLEQAKKKKRIKKLRII